MLAQRLMAAAFSWHIMMASVIDVRASSSALLLFAEGEDDESEVDDDDDAPPPPGDSGEEAVRKDRPELLPLPLLPLLPLAEDAAAATMRAHFASRARILAR